MNARSISPINKRDDRGLCCAGIIAHLPESLHHFVGIVPEPFPAFRLPLDDLKCRVTAATEAGGGGGKYKRARPCVSYNVLCGVGGDKSPHGSHGLAEGAHDHVDFLLNAEMFACPPAGLAQNADAVGVVDHYPGAVFCAAP